MNKYFPLSHYEKKSYSFNLFIERTWKMKKVVNPVGRLLHANVSPLWFIEQPGPRKHLGQLGRQNDVSLISKILIKLMKNGFLRFSPPLPVFVIVIGVAVRINNSISVTKRICHLNSFSFFISITTHSKLRKILSKLILKRLRNEN
jgi:hypothetical protein